MRLETQTVRIGEWLGDVPLDWNYNKFYQENLNHDKERHDKSVEYFKQMAQALKEGKEVSATTSGGFFHHVYHCGLYDGWVFWKPRPCFCYKSTLGTATEEYYNLQRITIKENNHDASVYNMQKFKG